MSWKDRFVLIAHRGASAYEPENTVRAVQRAIEMGADVVEIDVRATADGEVVVVHDEDLKRIAGVEKKVRELSLSEIKNLKVFGREPIPTLKEVLEVVGNRVGLFIELKEAGLENKVVELVKSFGLVDNVLVISFIYDTLKKVKEIEPSIDVGLLTYRYPLPIKEALKLKAFAILPKFSLVTPRTVKELHSHGLKVYTWVINDPSQALKYVGYGVDGIATDRPDIRFQLEKQQTLVKYRHQ